MLFARNATRARYLSKTSGKPFYASQISIFNPSDHIDTALTRCCGSLLWPDCTLSSLETLALKNRQVTQSIATQKKNFIYSFLIFIEIAVLNCNQEKENVRCFYFQTDGLIPAGLWYPNETLTVFTHLACSQKIYF